MKADKIQKRCRAAGFDRDSLVPVMAKVVEALDDVLAAVRQQQTEQDKLEEEMGDLLFACVNLSCHLDIKAEMALQKANLKFERRFRQVEQIIVSQGITLSEATSEQMRTAWQLGKSAE